MQLEERSNFITEALIIRSKVKWFEEGEKSSKYFLSLEKKRKSKTHVRKLINRDDEVITDPESILSNLGNYYNQIFESKNSNTEDECLKFVNQAKTKRLSEENKKNIEVKLTIQECYKSLTSMGSNITPGNDGISKEFYIAFWNELKNDMGDSFNCSFEKGQLTTTQRQVIIALLEKPDKDIRYAENWRPISLMNVDVKICRCSKCFKTFPREGFGTKPDYSGFNVDNWEKRTDELHRIHANKTLSAKCPAQLQKCVYDTGARYTVLPELPYYDCVRFVVIDPMHNLFLGISKLMLSLWKDSGVLGDKDFIILQNRVNAVQPPSEIGRIPTKIGTGFSGFTADQWKNWVCYYSLFALKGIQPSKHYNVWVQWYTRVIPQRKSKHWF
ncbi:Transposon TX1 uncharacterized 149 kDa protein [Exaiptasia diaphana]|nr:Transposon TX1 uncharacterized 149 kDa protein [Exaiptasia diaphana]